MKLNSIINLIVENPNSPRGYVELMKYYQDNKTTNNAEILKYLIENKFNENDLPNSHKKQ